MPACVALLRAVNLGPHLRVSQADLLAAADACGFEAAETYISSGNLVFRSGDDEKTAQTCLSAALEEQLGARVEIFIRRADELTEVLAGNPFADKPGNLAMVLFLANPPGAALFDGLVAPGGEQALPGRREIYLYYPSGQGRSRLRLPALSLGRVRNINTVTRLAAMALARA